MKRKINKKRFLILVITLLVILNISIFAIIKLTITKIIFVKDNSVLVGKSFVIKDYVEKITNGKLLNGDEEVIFEEIGENIIKVKYQNKFGVKKTKEYIVKVIDNESPVINGPSKITIVEGDDDDLLKDVIVNDNYYNDIKVIIDGEYSRDKADTYNLYYVAKDGSGNETKVPFTLQVNEKKSVMANQNESAYFVRVNKTFNVAMVYAKDSNGEYTKLVKTFVVSTGGDNTPNGIWTTTDRYETLSLVGGVWGHYTLRIEGPIWFHSVPYFSKPVDGHWNDLEYEEYNKLGTSASLGCVRLASADAKWIYENIPWHTKVEIYESDELPEEVVKPTSIKIDITSDNKGWDPTDPDPENPWNL